MNRPTTKLHPSSTETVRRWMMPAACLFFAAITVLAYVVSTKVDQPSEANGSLSSSAVEPTAPSPLPAEEAEVLLGPSGTIEIQPDQSKPAPSVQKPQTPTTTADQTASVPPKDVDTTDTSLNSPVTVLTQTFSEVEVEVDPSQQADTYQGLLASSGLDADGIDEEALADLGAAVCLMAKLSDTPSAYEDSRSEWVDTATPGSNLEGTHMEAAVDAVTRAYCPEVADRLSIAEPS